SGGRRLSRLRASAELGLFRYGPRVDQQLRSWPAFLLLLSGRRRTPGPLPFVNSMPADSNARLSAVTVELCAANTPGAPSRRFMVGSDTPEARARSRCSQRNNARAARISSLVIANESNFSGIKTGPRGLLLDT